MTHTFDEAIEIVLSRYDVEDIIEALDITATDLLELPDFDERFNDNRHKFEELDYE